VALGQATDTLRRTPLFERHRSAGAKLVPFAGWDMPVQYEGIRAEHVQVRTAAGMFDVSHMGQIETTGPEAERFLQRLLSNDVAKLAEGGAQYSVLCRADGGVLDDLFTYRLAGGGFLTVTNAANHDKGSTWTCTTPTPTGRCWPFRGPRPGRRWARSPTASCRRGCAPPSSSWPA
jgi:aminomethyltransferase